MHQVNLEYLARVVFVGSAHNGNRPLAYPDTLVGTDSHTTMINGLGVLGWGVGGIEAEAAMLGQPVSMLIPQVVGLKLTGKLKEGSTATDLVLTITEMLRQEGVVGKFVEFYGPGLHTLALADRATIGNMSPEYGATCGIFPIDKETLNYLRLTGRREEQVALVEAYCKEQGLFHTPDSPEANYSDVPAARPGVGGAERGRAEAAAGPGAAVQCSRRIPADAAHAAAPGQQELRDKHNRAASRARAAARRSASKTPNRPRPTSR